MRPALLDRACAAPSPRASRCSWPTNSSSVCGPHPRGERLVARRGRLVCPRGGSSPPVSKSWSAMAQVLLSPGVPEPAQLERRTTELLQRLIRFNTVNPPGNEQAAQEFLRDTLAAAGLRVRAAVGVRGPAEPGRAPARAGPTARRSACSGTSTPCSRTRRTGTSTRGRATWRTAASGAAARST